MTQCESDDAHCICNDEKMENGTRKRRHLADAVAAMKGLGVNILYAVVAVYCL